MTSIWDGTLFIDSIDQQDKRDALLWALISLAEAKYPTGTGLNRNHGAAVRRVDICTVGCLEEKMQTWEIYERKSVNTTYY